MPKTVECNGKGMLFTVDVTMKVKSVTTVVVNTARAQKCAAIDESRQIDGHSSGFHWRPTKFQYWSKRNGKYHMPFLCVMLD